MAKQPSPQELFKRWEARQPKDPTPQERRFAVGDPNARPADTGNFTTGVGAGFAGLAGSLASGIQTITGLDTSNYQQQQANLAAEYAARIEAPQTLAELQQRGFSAGNLAGYAAQGLGKSVPEIAALAASGGLAGIGARVGLRLGGALEAGGAAGATAAQVAAASSAAKAINRARLAGAYTTATVARTGDAAQNMEDQSGTVNRGAALGLGALAGIATVLGPEGALGRLAPFNASGAGVFKGAARGTAAGVAGETTAELAENEFSNNLARRAVDESFDLMGAKAIESRQEAAFGGAVLGGTIGGARGALEGAFGKPAAVTPTDENPTDLTGGAPTTSGPSPSPSPSGAPVNTLPEVAPLQGELLPPSTPAGIPYQAPALPAPEGPAALLGLDRPALPAPESPTVMYGGRTGEVSTDINQASVPDTIASRAARAAGVDPAQQNWTGEQPPPPVMGLPAPSKVFSVGSDGQITIPSDLSESEAQNNALLARFDPAMYGQTGEQPGGEPIDSPTKTAIAERVNQEKATESFRASARRAILGSGMKMNSKAAKAVMESANPDQALARLMTMYDGNGSMKELPTIEKMVGALTGGLTPDEYKAQIESRVKQDSTMPEPIEDVEAQIAAMLDQNSKKDTVFIATGTPVPAVPEGVRRVDTSLGTVLTTSPVKEGLAKLDADNMTSEAMGKLLDYTTPKAQSDGTVVQALNNQGRVVWEEVTNRDNLEKSLARAQEMVPEGGSTNVDTVDKVLARREKGAPEMTIGQQTDAPSLTAAQPESSQPRNVASPAVAPTVEPSQPIGSAPVESAVQAGDRAGAREPVASSGEVVSAVPAAPVGQPALTQAEPAPAPVSTGKGKLTLRKVNRMSKTGIEALTDADVAAADSATQEAVAARKAEIKAIQDKRDASETARQAKANKTGRGRQLGSTQAKKNNVGGGNSDVDLSPEGVAAAKAIPSKPVTPRQKQVEAETTAEDKARKKRMAETEALFNENAEGEKDIDGKPIKWSSLSTALQDQWDASEKSIAAYRNLIDGPMGLKAEQRARRLSERFKGAASNTDLGYDFDGEYAAAKAYLVSLDRIKDDMTDTQVEAEIEAEIKRRKAEEKKQNRATKPISKIVAENDFDSGDPDADRLAMIEDSEKRQRNIKAGKGKPDVKFLRAVEKVLPGISLANVRDNKASSLLDAIKGELPYPEMNRLAARLADVGRSVLDGYTVSFGDPRDLDGEPVVALINHGSKEIVMSEGSTGIDLLHELFHGVVDARLRDNAKARAELKALMKSIQRRMPDDPVVQNAFENEFEFLNYYFTVPAFRRAADATSSDQVTGFIGKLLNLAKNLIQSLREIFMAEGGSSSTNINAEMNRILNNVLGTPPSGPQGPRGTKAPTQLYMRKAEAKDFTGPTAQANQQARAAVQKLGEILRKSPTARTLGSKINRAVRRGMTVGDLVDSYGESLPALKMLNDLRTKMENRFNELTLAATPLFKELGILSASKAEEFQKLTDLINESTLARFRLDEPITSKGNAGTVQRTTEDLDPKTRAEFQERRRQDLESTSLSFDDQIQVLMDARAALRDAAVGKTKAEASAEVDAQIAALRARKKEAMADVRAKYDAELTAATKEQVEGRQRQYADMKARFDALDPKAQANYTKLMEHYKATRQAEFLQLVNQAMRRLNDPAAFKAMPEKAAQIEALQKELIQEMDSERRAELRKQIRDLAKDFDDAAASKLVADRIEAITRTQADFDGGVHAYAPLMRFGNFLVVARSNKYNELEGKLKAAQTKLEALEATSAEFKEMRRIEALIQNLQNDRQGADQTTVDGINVLLKRLEVDLRKATRAVTRGPNGPTDISKARVEINQIKFEIKQARRNGKDYTFQTFDSELAAERAVDILKAEGLNATKHLKEDFYREFDSISSGVLSKLRHDNPKDAAEKKFNEMITEMYLQQLPESSALKRRMKREGIAGFSTDLLQVYAAYNRSHAFFLSRLEYNDQISDSMELLRQQARANADFEDVYNVMKSQQVMNMSGGDTPLTDLAVRVGAFWYLALTPAFLVLNLTQNFMATMPVLVGHFSDVGAGKMSSMLSSAMKDVGSIMSAQFKNRGDLPALEFEADFNKSNLKPEEKELFDFLSLRSLLNFTQTMELVDRRVGSQSKIGTVAQNIEKAGWFLPHHTEVVNRGAAALVAYRLAREKGMDKEAAQEFAAKIVRTTHGDYSETNKPEFIRTVNRVPGGKMLTLFKSYQQMMVMLIASNMRNAFFRGDLTAEEKSVARRTLAYIFGTHALFAGAMGVPGYAGLAMVGNTLGALFGDDDEPFDFDTEFRSAAVDAFGSVLGEDAGRAAGEVFNKGVLRALPVIGQLDISSRIAANNLFSPFLFNENPTASGRDVLANNLLSVTGPIGGIIANMYDGAAAFEQGEDMSKVIAMMTPKPVGDLMRAYSLATEGAETRSGAPLYEPGVVEIAGQLLGFRPSRSAESGEMRRASLKLNEALKEREDRIKADYRRAVEDRDPKARLQAEKDFREFLRKHPDRGSMRELRQSVESRRRRDSEYQGARRVTDSEFIESRVDFGNVD